MRRFSSSSIATIGRIWWFDLRTMGLLALAVLMALAFIGSQTLKRVSDGSSTDRPAVWIQLLLWLAVFLAIRGMSPARTAFWRVRPISPTMVLAAKLLLLLALLVSGPVLIDYLFLHQANIGGGVPLTSLSESTLNCLSSILLPAFLAAVYPDRRFVVASLAVGTAVALSQVVTMWFAPSGASVPELTFPAYSSAVALLFLSLAYLRPQASALAPWAFALLFGGYPVVCALALQPWPESPDDWNFERLAVLPEIDQGTRLRIAPPESGSFEDPPSRDLYLFVEPSLEGTVESLGYRGRILEAHFEIEGKRSWHVQYPDSKKTWEPSAFLWMANRYRDPMGLDRDRGLRRTPAMVISRVDTASYWNEKGTLALSVGLREEEAEFLGWLPLEKGAELVEDGNVHILGNFRLAEGSLHIQLGRHWHFNSLREHRIGDLEPGVRVPGWIPASEMSRFDDYEHQPDLWKGGGKMSFLPSAVLNLPFRGPGIGIQLATSVRYLPDPRLESTPTYPEKIELWRSRLRTYSERTVRLEGVTLQQLARRPFLSSEKLLEIPRAALVDLDAQEWEMHR